ncbi:hypothetical protein L198_05882 [Cryptococcus wingfieldii CBS 7118]|uniref:Monocarboxylic acid transporter n=1 Tax=Cryptococcus wingfieldii CBS 7118 TaxID=1295528 RepID=A0A1E3IRZ0_9TREE|nr:hypothetical protein L198_05882 [Cryptococcus wingfieldii CBS 7118]ODN91370.1 hypothetical protein L198_05882 [Cryptococcus wingfieldii CBS 7118]
MTPVSNLAELSYNQSHPEPAHSIIMTPMSEYSEYDFSESVPATPVAWTPATEYSEHDLFATAQSRNSRHAAIVNRIDERGPEDAEPSYALPPVDEGWRAWLFLFAATVIVLLVWGLPFSVGILALYWNDTLFKNQGGLATLTLASTLQTGLLYICTAAAGFLMPALPRWRRELQFFGLLFAVLSMIASAFATKPVHILLCFGCVYPFSGITYMPCITLVFEWFHTRRGLATGILYAGTGLGGIIMPFLVSFLLDKVGYKATMIGFGLGYALVGSAAILAIRPRIPIVPNSHGQRERRGGNINWASLKSRGFIVGTTMVFLMSLGNFIPSLWLPSYANALNLTNPNGTIILVILNASSIPGNALMGYLSDRIPLKLVMLFNLSMAALSCAILWGFGTNGGMLVGFSIIFGALGLSFATLWTGMISVIAKDDPVAPPLVLAIFTLVRGIGSLVCGPISQSLLKLTALNGKASGAYGLHNYGILIIYATVTILASGATGLMWKS